MLTLRPTKLYSDIPALDVAGLGESLTEGAQAACERGRRFSAEIADHRLGCLLRPCPERRQEGAGANRDHEIAPVDGVGHSSSLEYTPDTYISKLKRCQLRRLFSSLDD